jgi:hypothetical protein
MLRRLHPESDDWAMIIDFNFSLMIFWTIVSALLTSKIHYRLLLWYQFLLLNFSIYTLPRIMMNLTQTFRNWWSFVCKHGCKNVVNTYTRCIPLPHLFTDCDEWRRNVWCVTIPFSHQNPYRWLCWAMVIGALVQFVVVVVENPEKGIRRVKSETLWQIIWKNAVKHFILLVFKRTLCTLRLPFRERGNIKYIIYILPSST